MRAMEVRHSAAQGSFAVRLRAAREHARLTQEDLAIAGKVTCRRIISLELGGCATPSPELVGRLAGLLKVNGLWLMAGDLAGSQFRPAWWVGGGA